MTHAEAEALTSAVRRAGAELVAGLETLRRSAPQDLRAWELATARALAVLQDALLEPRFEQHPEVRPKELGGPTR